MLSPYFVFSKMQAEAGQQLDDIIARKEAERCSGDGMFWWGVGNSLGQAVIVAARINDGLLPVIWSVMRSVPRSIDVAPKEVMLWTAYEDSHGRVQAIPDQIIVTSRHSGRDHHYAMVCRSTVPLTIGDCGPFDPDRCRTPAGNVPGASQVTALLQGEFDGQAEDARYRIAFRAEMIQPWFVRLVRPRPLSLTAKSALDAWRTEGWRATAHRVRQETGPVDVCSNCAGIGHVGPARPVVGKDGAGDA